MVELLFSKYYANLIYFSISTATISLTVAVNFFGLRCDSKTARISPSFFTVSQIDLFLPKIFTTSAYDFFSLLSFKDFFFFCGPFLQKSLSNFITILFLFYVLAFLVRGRWISAPWPGTESVHPAQKRGRNNRTEVRLKEVLCWLCSLAHPNCQFHQACPLGPLLSKNKVYLNSSTETAESWPDSG